MLNGNENLNIVENPAAVLPEEPAVAQQLEEKLEVMGWEILEIPQESDAPNNSNDSIESGWEDTDAEDFEDLDNNVGEHKDNDDIVLLPPANDPAAYGEEKRERAEGEAEEDPNDWFQVEHAQAEGEEYKNFQRLLDLEYARYLAKYGEISYADWLRDLIERAKQGLVVLADTFLEITAEGVLLGGKLLEGVVVAVGEVVAVAGNGVELVGHVVGSEGVQAVGQGIEGVGEHIQNLGQGVGGAARVVADNLNEMAARIRRDELDYKIQALTEYNYLENAAELTAAVRELQAYLRHEYKPVIAPARTPDIEKIVDQTHRVLQTAVSNPEASLRHIDVLQAMANEKDVHRNALLRGVVTAAKVLVVSAIAAACAILLLSLPPVGAAITFGLVALFGAWHFGRAAYAQHHEKKWGEREKSISSVCTHARFFANAQPRPEVVPAEDLVRNNAAAI